MWRTRRTEPQWRDLGDGPRLSFHLGPSVQLDTFQAESFQRISVRLLSSVVSGKDLVVADHARLAEARE